MEIYFPHLVLVTFWFSLCPPGHLGPEPGLLVPSIKCSLDRHDLNFYSYLKISVEVNPYNKQTLILLTKQKQQYCG